MHRREFVVTGALALAAAPLAFRNAAVADVPRSAASSTWTHVQTIAEKLAREPYAPPVERVPPALKDIGYDVYRDIEFRLTKALWHGENLGFEVQFSPTAYIYHSPVEIFLIDNEKITPFVLTAAMFEWGPLRKDISSDTDIACSGFRILAPLNDSKRLDELTVFQGASYFRGLGRGHQYGLSARGLALNTGKPEPEEFPLFRSFWIERPAHPSRIVVYALLDSPSTSGAFRFAISPGAITTMEIDSRLFPRVDLAHVGIAPLTSMFWFDTRESANRQDFRAAVHDSEGLSVLSQSGERLWRPLSSPEHLQASAFAGPNPRGFGLLQRSRDFSAYQDLEARYERRPSAWVERRNDWGDGYVELIEIPAKTEYFDNIVAYWRPSDPLRAGQQYAFDYRLHWCAEPPEAAPRFRVKRTGFTEESRPGFHRFAVDYEMTAAYPSETIGIVDEAFGLIRRVPGPLQPIEAVLSASGGVLSGPVVQANPHVNGVRVGFELDPRGHDTVELRLSLVVGGEVDSEVWLYRWLRPRPAAASPSKP